MLVLVGNPQDRFSNNEARLITSSSPTFGLNFISLYTHVQNDSVINTNEQVSDIQNGIQKEVLGLM